MIDLDELNLNNDIQRFTERLMIEIENIHSENDLIKLFKECVEYNEYDKITEIMIDGDYIESALNYGYGFEAIPYLKNYDLIESDIEAVLEHLEKEDKVYQSLEWVMNNFMECEFIKKFYPESKRMDYTPEDLFKREGNIEELGCRLNKEGVIDLEDKQHYVHKLMDMAEKIMRENSEDALMLSKLRNMDFSDFNVITGELNEDRNKREVEIEFER